MKSAKVEVLADKYDGKPSDVCVDDKVRIYLTARSAVKDIEGETSKDVYRIDPNGAVTALLQRPKVQMPNGFITSPDNKTLYLIESHPNANQHRDIRAYDLKSDGSLIHECVLINFYPGRSGDGRQSVRCRRTAQNPQHERNARHAARRPRRFTERQFDRLP